MESVAKPLSITSEGLSGKKIIRKIREKGFYFKNGRILKNLLSPDFKATDNLKTELPMEIKDENIDLSNVETVCLFRANFSDSELKAAGLDWLMNMFDFDDQMWLFTKRW
jgi:hypothetical protein